MALYRMPTYNSMPSLLTLCMDYFLIHIDLYLNELSYLPVNIKNRILKRIMAIKQKFPDSQIKSIFKSLINSQVIQIDFSLYDVNDDFIQIISKCYKLKKIILTRQENKTLTSKALVDVMPSFKNLQIFSAPNCDAINDEVMEIIIKNNDELSELDVAGCHYITDETLNLLTKLKKLLALNISRTTITNKGVSVFLLKGCSTKVIKEIRIANCLFITSEAINMICEHCSSLEIFIFYKSIKNSDANFVDFEKENFKKIKQLTWTVHW